MNNVVIKRGILLSTILYVDSGHICRNDLLTKFGRCGKCKCTYKNREYSLMKIRVNNNSVDRLVELLSELESKVILLGDKDYPQVARNILLRSIGVEPLKFHLKSVCYLVTVSIPNYDEKLEYVSSPNFVDDNTIVEILQSTFLRVSKCFDDMEGVTVVVSNINGDDSETFVMKDNTIYRESELQNN